MKLFVFTFRFKLTTMHNTAILALCMYAIKAKELTGDESSSEIPFISTFEIDGQVHVDFGHLNNTVEEYLPEFEETMSILLRSRAQISKSNILHRDLIFLAEEIRGYRIQVTTIQ